MRPHPGPYVRRTFDRTFLAANSQVSAADRSFGTFGPVCRHHPARASTASSSTSIWHANPTTYYLGLINLRKVRKVREMVSDQAIHARTFETKGYVRLRTTQRSSFSGAVRPRHSP